MDMRRPRSGVGAELVPLVLILACLAGSLALIVAVHRRTVANRSPSEPVAVVIAPPPAPPAPQPAPVAPAEVPEPGPEPEPPAPPPPEDPTPKALAKLTSAEAEELLEASRADRKAAAFEEARKAALAESERWRRRESLVNAQLSKVEGKARKAEADADALAFERDALLKERDARKAAVTQARSRPGQAILPHKGPNGTWRRPIIVECTNGMAILQPQGIGFGLLELASGFGPSSNPFVAAIARQAVKIQRTASPDGAPVVPYIFFLVRPDGVRPYYEARGRLEPLGITFGYELADQDWEVEFPDLDDKATWDGSAPTPPPGTNPLAGIPTRPPGSSPAEDENFPDWNARVAANRRNDRLADGDFTWPGQKALAGNRGLGSSRTGDLDGPGLGNGQVSGARSATGVVDDPLDGIPGLGGNPRRGAQGASQPGGPVVAMNPAAETHGGSNPGLDGDSPWPAPPGEPAPISPKLDRPSTVDATVPPVVEGPTGTSPRGGGPGRKPARSGSATPGEPGPFAGDLAPPGLGDGPSLPAPKPTQGGGFDRSRAAIRPGSPAPGDLPPDDFPAVPPSSTARSSAPGARPVDEPGSEFVWPAKPKDGPKGSKADAASDPIGESLDPALPSNPSTGPDDAPPVIHRGPFTRPLAMGVQAPSTAGTRDPASGDATGNRGSGGGQPARKMIGRAVGSPGNPPPSGPPPQGASGIGLGMPSMGGTPPSDSPSPKSPSLPEPGQGPMIDRRFEVVVVCGKEGVIVQPGGYRVTPAALKDRDGLLKKQMVALVKTRRAADPKVILEPKVRFLVQPGGESTYWSARGQVLLSGLDWPMTTQVADRDPVTILPSEGW